MKWKHILMIVSILIIGISCTKQDPPPIWINGDHKQVIFFSDKEKYEQELSYYDAIIILKSKFPEEMKHMKILSDSELKNFDHILHLNHCPAIIVYDQNQVIYIAEGAKTTEEIVTSLSTILSET